MSIPEISGDLVIKSKLSSLSDSVALRQLNPSYKKFFVKAKQGNYFEGIN